MVNYDNRILLQVTVYPEKHTKDGKNLQALYYMLGNTLTGKERMPNIENICKYCDEKGSKIGAYILHACEGLKVDSNIYNLKSQKITGILNGLADADRGKLRILLYVGNKNDIEDFKIDEATHNMIVQFCKGKKSFYASMPHKNFPNFYQSCNCIDDALLYIEALLVDACMCHFFGVSDAAFHHDNKQQISKDKVAFLKNFYKTDEFYEMSELSQKAISYVVSEIDENKTPYMSFFSIFTLAAKDINAFEQTYEYIASSFDEYYILWNNFQKWYYKKYNKLFTAKQEITDPISTIFNRNKYYGQISNEEIIVELKKFISNHPQKKMTVDCEKGLCDRYAIVIIKNMPPDGEFDKKFKALFSGQLHQAKWRIVHWSELDRFDPISDFIEIVPFMIDEE